MVQTIGTYWGVGRGVREEKGWGLLLVIIRKAIVSKDVDFIY